MVSFPTPDHDSAWRGSVGRFEPAPRLARILFLLLFMSFADAQQCTTTCIGAPGYASDCDCAIEFASEFATEYGYDFITVNGVSYHGYSLTNGPMNVQVAAETAQLAETTFSTTTFGAVQACTRGSLEALPPMVCARMADPTRSSSSRSPRRSSASPAPRAPRALNRRAPCST